MIGTGYVGLVSGACFADFGHQVICVDKDGDKIASLRRGEIPIFEPGLDALVAANVKAKRLDFSTDLSAPVAEADAVFIAVGTPSRRGDGHADLTYVYAAAREIAASISGFTVVITKSTVPVGTGDEVERLIREVNPSAEFVVASNPEFPRLHPCHRPRGRPRAGAHAAVGKTGGVLNLGTGKGFSVREILAAIANETGREVPHVVKPRRAGDPTYLVADASAARATLNFHTAHSDLPTIIRTAWAWHKKAHPLKTG